MKHCRKCDTTKDTSEFAKDRSAPDGLQYKCKSCVRQWEKDNAEKRKQQKAQWHKDNAEARNKQIKQWEQNNPEKRKQGGVQWRKENPDKVTAWSAARRASKLQRTPKWADRGAIKVFYTEAQRLTKLTGISHHVDHIIPLQGENVSGLHVETNLQVIPYYENLCKSNKYEIGDIDV